MTLKTLRHLQGSLLRNRWFPYEIYKDIHFLLALFCSDCLERVVPTLPMLVLPLPMLSLVLDNHLGKFYCAHVEEPFHSGVEGNWVHA